MVDLEKTPGPDGDPDDGRASLRAGDTDRQAVAERLSGALEEGRLTVPEYDERLREVYAARTYGELERVTADLPASSPATARVPSRERRIGRPGVVDAFRPWLGVALILNVIWLVTSIARGEANFYWPMFPLGIWGAVIVAGLLFRSPRRDS